MAIEQGRIVVTSAKREGIANDVRPTPFCPSIASTAPPDFYAISSDTFPLPPPLPDDDVYILWFGDRAYLAKAQPAEYEGQVRIVGTSSSREYSMYVVVDLGGQLEWKQVKKSSGALDPRTGRPYDANAAFYSPLAD